MPVAARADAPADGILTRIEAHRSGDGGYAPKPGAADGTTYGRFLATAHENSPVTVWNWSDGHPVPHTTPAAQTDRGRAVRRDGLRGL